MNEAAKLRRWITDNAKEDARTFEGHDLLVATIAEAFRTERDRSANVIAQEERAKHKGLVAAAHVVGWTIEAITWPPSSAAAEEGIKVALDILAAAVAEIHETDGRNGDPR